MKERMKRKRTGFGQKEGRSTWTEHSCETKRRNKKKTKEKGNQ
jgi:hypothetical protein